MKNQDHKEKLENYKMRYRFWTDKAVDQLSYTNNLLLVLGVGIMGFILKEIETDHGIVWSIVQINYSITFFRASAFMALFSIFSGVLTVFYRLYDLRVTRNINWSRMRYLKLKGKPILDKNLGKKEKLPLNKFLKLMSHDDCFINLDTPLEEFEERLKKNRELSRQLGGGSWRNLKFQIFWLVISVLFFLISYLF